MNKVTPLAFLLFPVFLITLPLWLMIWQVKAMDGPDTGVPALFLFLIQGFVLLAWFVGPDATGATISFPLVTFVGLNCLGCLVWALWSFVWMPFYWNLVGGKTYEAE